MHGRCAAMGYRIQGVHPGSRTGHIHNVAPCTYDIHVHMHRDCACAFHLHLHLGHNAPPSATRIMHAARQRQQRNVPYRDAACTPQHAAVTA